MNESAQAAPPVNHTLLRRLVDCHAHPHDTASYASVRDEVAKIECFTCVMSSNLRNQDTTAQVAEQFPAQTLPCFGIHPWFCHALSLACQLPDKQTHYSQLFGPTEELDAGLLERLPDPILLSDFIQELSSNLGSHPTAMIGEVGLDKSFKIPKIGGYIAPHSMPDREGSIEYTQLRTPMQHQAAVLEAQFDVAVEMKRNMSVHCVQAQGPMIEFLKRSAKKHGQRCKDINIDLHSFGGSVETMQEIVRLYSNVYFSFSTIINSRSPRWRNLVQAVPRNRLLVESDWNSPVGSSGLVWEAANFMAEARSWSIEETYVLPR